MRSALRQPAFTLPVRSGLLLALALGLVGCTSAPDRVVVSLEAVDLDPATAMDRIVLTITASTTASGTALCEPFEVSLPLVPEATSATEMAPITLPFTVAIEPGTQFNQLLLVRIEGRLLDDTVVYRDERMATLAGGEHQLHIRLTADCLHQGTGPREYCQNGVVLESTQWPIFDEGAFVQAGMSCTGP